MRRTALFGIVLALIASTTTLQAQSLHGDYDWATNLHKQFGFDDLAEEIYQDMISGPGRSETERLQGKLGLAGLRADQAQEAASLDEQLAMLKEAIRIMQEAVDQWPDKGEQAYYRAVFHLVDVIQRRGELAMTAIREGTAGREQEEELRKEANSDFGRAEVMLEKVRSNFGTPDPDEQPEQWLVKAEAWYRLCQLKLDKSRTMKANSTARAIAIDEAAREVEEFIFENETENENALLAAYYAYLLMGEVNEEKGDEERAISNYRSIVDNSNLWFDDLPARVKGLHERGYWLLLKFLNGKTAKRGPRYDESVVFGRQMQQKFEQYKIEYSKLGRAARVELAKALFRTGEMDQALGIASEVIEAGRRDASATLANRLISEIIAATPDKTTFTPATILAAARGAFSSGAEGRDQAELYYGILLQILPKVQNEEERDYMGAEAWYARARIAYWDERVLEAALAAREGAMKFKDVRRDDLAPNLVKLWDISVRQAHDATGSAAIETLARECAQWQIDNPNVSERSAGDLVYNQARARESEALALKKAGELDAAAHAYQEAAGLYKQGVDLGGRYRERAMVKQGVMRLNEAEIFGQREKPAEAAKAFQGAIQVFRDYLAFSKDPKNTLTDPRDLDFRRTAEGEARYSIADASLQLAAGKEQTPEGQQALREVVSVLDGFHVDHEDQKSLVVFALEKRQKAQLDLGDGAGALDTYRTMKEVAPDHPKTAVAGLNVAKSRREPAEKAFDRFRGKLDPEDLIVWDEMLERPGAREAWKDLHEAYLLYREWLLGSESGGDKYDNWKMIAFYFYNIGAWDEACDLYRQAVERFKGTSKLTPDDLLYLESKLVTALLSKAQREVAAGNLEGAQELWHEAGRFVDDLMNPDSKFSKYPATWRQAAQVYGGFLQRVPGGFRFVPTTGEYDKALVIWKDIESHLTKAGKEGTPEWWEARFYTYLTVYESRRASGSSLTPVREGLNQLKLIRPNLGGEQWKRRFDWLEQKLGM